MPSKKAPTAGEVLTNLSGLWDKRNAVYKDNWRNIGKVMEGFFPNGVTLLTPNDHIRYHLFMLSAVKNTRYANNWMTGHADSMDDAAVYSAMLRSVDEEFKLGRGRDKKKKAKRLRIGREVLQQNPKAFIKPELPNEKTEAGK